MGLFVLVRSDELYFFEGKYFPSFFTCSVVRLFNYPPDDEHAASPDIAVSCLAEQDHEVQEDKIMLVSLLMAELGVHSVAYAFPKVKIITTAVDKSLDGFLHVVPGIGKSSHALADSLCQIIVVSSFHVI